MKIRQTMRDYILKTKKHLKGYLMELRLTVLAYSLLGFGAIVLIIGFVGNSFIAPDLAIAKDILPLIVGLVVPMFTLGSALLVVENLRVSTLQNFNNNFFKLIEFHHKIVDSIQDNIDYISDKGADGSECDKESSKGRLFFDDLAWRIAIDFEYLKAKLIDKKSVAELSDIFDKPSDFSNKPRKKGQSKTEDKELLNMEASDKLELFKNIYKHYFHIHHSALGHYFRNLFHIVNFVDTQKILKQEQKDIYMAMLRAQLSNYEILLLAYNGMYSYGSAFKPLIERYELIKRLNNEKRLPKNRGNRIIDLDLLCEAYPHWPRAWEKEDK